MLAKRNLGLAFNKLADDISRDDMFSLLSEQDINKNTPLVTAALSSNGVALAAMLNFYSSNIDMSEIHLPENLQNRDIIDELLHTQDLLNHNLTYHIIQTSRKCLGPYGTILQMEKDFHVKEEEVGGFLQLELCLQRNQGSTVETSLVMKLLSSTREATKGALWARIIIFVFLFSFAQLSLHVLDVVSDGLLGAHYFEDWVYNSQTIIEAHNCKNITLQFYPTQLHAILKFVHCMFYIFAPSLLNRLYIFQDHPC